MSAENPPRTLAIFASGGGSNAAAILSYFDALGASSPLRPSLVVSNRDSAPVLARAREAGMTTLVLADSDDGDALEKELAAADIEFIALAGYLKLVPAVVTRRWRGAMVNVHPALLPDFGGHGMYGRHVHEAVLAAGRKASGATVHFVDDEYDRGASIAQARVPVLPGDDPGSLAARVLMAEHALYPRVLHALALGLVALRPDAGVAILGDPTRDPRITPSPVPLEFCSA